MSLEIALAENTSAIQRLAELFAAFMAGPNGATAVPAVNKPAPAPSIKKADKPAEAPGKPEASKPTSQASPTTSPAAAPAASGDKVTYQMAREQVLKFAATHRDAIKAINTKHGIAKLSALLEDEADFFSVNDQAKLEAVFADLSALA